MLFEDNTDLSHFSVEIPSPYGLIHPRGSRALSPPSAVLLSVPRCEERALPEKVREIGCGCRPAVHACTAEDPYQSWHPSSCFTASHLPGYRYRGNYGNPFPGRNLLRIALQILPDLFFRSFVKSLPAGACFSLSSYTSSCCFRSISNIGKVT